MKIEKKMQNILLDLRILKYDEKDDDTVETITVSYSDKASNFKEK